MRTGCAYLPSNKDGVKVKVGDIIAFKGQGVVFILLSFLLGIFEPKWRRRKFKPWHLAIASQPANHGWYIIEAVAGGVREHFLTNQQLAEASSYTWLNEPPTNEELERFRTLYLGRPYDVTAYFGVVFSYLIKKYLHFSLRVVDTEFMCWELVSAFARFMGKPFQPNWEYPVISKIIERLEKGVFSYD